MASTFTWAQAINTVAPFVKSIPTSTIDSVVIDQLNAFIWRAYPWRWAQASLTSGSGALTLVDSTQDYSIGTLTGAGYYRLLAVRITRSDVTPNIVREKDITNWLAPNLETKGSIDSIQAIAYNPITSGLRLDRAASVPTGTTYRIDGEYQFSPVKITSSTAVIVFPDEYFSVAVEGLKWKYYQLGDDKRADGQKALFLGELQQMIQDEDYGNAQGTRFPEGSIGVGRGYGTGGGLFGAY